MNKATKVLLTAALAVMTSGAAMASHVCAYVNDEVNGPNAAEGYKIGPGNATVHVGPYSTNGSGTGNGNYVGRLGATRVREGDLYVEDVASNNITHFTINKTDCTLTLDPALYPSGDTGGALGDPLVITLDGRTMFVGSSGDDHIYSHAIAADGSLGSAFVEASTPDPLDGIAMSPDGKTLVVSYAFLQQVCAYPISGGHLGAPNCQSTAAYPAGVSIDPASACVYAGEANGYASEVAAFTLTGGVLGAATDYNPFGPGINSFSVQVNWDNKVLYVSNSSSAQVTTGSIAPGCKLTYRSIITDGFYRTDSPGQIAQDKRVHGYVVTGDFNRSEKPRMGIFRADVNGRLTHIGRFPLMNGDVGPVTVVVVGVK
jgi:6-phosphogluconolactonase (cycloisomerase 2 family)